MTKRDALNTLWLETFVAVADAGKRTAVANDTGRHQASVTRDIQRLETWLGGTLLFNGNVPAELSPAGEAFLPVAQEVLTLLQEARSAAVVKVTPTEPRISGKDIQIP